MIDVAKLLWRNEEGQDIAEYAVMLAVILVIVIGTIRLIGGNANNVFSSGRQRYLAVNRLVAGLVVRSLAARISPPRVRRINPGSARKERNEPKPFVDDRRLGAGSGPAGQLHRL